MLDIFKNISEKIRNNKIIFFSTFLFVILFIFSLSWMIKNQKIQDNKIIFFSIFIFVILLFFVLWLINRNNKCSKVPSTDIETDLEMDLKKRVSDLIDVLKDCKDICLKKYDKSCDECNKHYQTLEDDFMKKYGTFMT